VHGLEFLIRFTEVVLERFTVGHLFTEIASTQMNLVPTLDAERGRLLLLAPENSVPDAFTGVEQNPLRHATLLAGLQRLRGRVYLDDGAIQPSHLSPDGRYVQPEDQDAWHLITLDAQGEVSGCARYLAYSGHLPFSQTGVSSASLSASHEWASPFRSAVESQIKRAARLGIDYVEVGGWALTPEVRRTTEALRIALGMFSLGRLLGGCIGLTTATVRHCSSSILRRIGGQPLSTMGVEIPGYFDPSYRCQMEILRFESAHPTPRFEPWIEELKTYLSAVPLIQCNQRISEQTAA
jgi:hypothetical protein